MNINRLLNKSSGIKISHIFIHGILILFGLCCTIPILLVFSISMSEEKIIALRGYSIMPVKFSLNAYKYIFKSPEQILNAYAVTITVTLIGAVTGLLLASMLAYVLSRNDYKYKNYSSFFVFFTMLFNGGLVPFYILVSQKLHLKNTIFALILPYLVIPWFVLLMKGFLSVISISIIESAKIDGASEWRIFFRIVIPVAKPGLATVGLFYILMYWNDWWLGLLFIEKPDLVPIQLMLNNVMENIDYLTRNVIQVNVGVEILKLPSLSARMAICTLGMAPVLFVFPFFQKYFVKGLMVGSVKG